MGFKGHVLYMIWYLTNMVNQGQSNHFNLWGFLLFPLFTETFRVVCFPRNPDVLVCRMAFCLL